MNNPLVSIIIPVYNNQKHLKETIESAINQTWKKKEILIIDDGSSDMSLEIAKKFEPLGVKVLTQSNKGACAARNKGLKESNGDYIQFLDADDVLSPDKIEEQLICLETQTDRTLATCSWGSFTNSVDLTSFQPDELWQDHRPVNWLIKAWNSGLMMQTACWLTPRGLIEEAGDWNENLKNNPNDDGEFFCRVILKCDQIKFIRKSRVYYRTYVGPRVSQNKSKTAISSLLETFISYEINISKVEKSERVFQAIIKNYSYFIYRYYNIFPDLTKNAEKQIKKFNCDFTPFSPSKKFTILTTIIGFKNTLRTREAIKSIKNIANTIKLS